jgi:hypothetical protein
LRLARARFFAVKSPSYISPVAEERREGVSFVPVISNGDASGEDAAK